MSTESLTVARQIVIITQRFFIAGELMIHEYCKILPDTENIIVTFTDIHFSQTQGESITVRFERANQNGFDIAEYVLPVCYCKKCIGFTEDEEFKLRRFAEKNSWVIWEIAREDGEVIADPF